MMKNKDQCLILQIFHSEVILTIMCQGMFYIFKYQNVQEIFQEALNLDVLLKKKWIRFFNNNKFKLQQHLVKKPIQSKIRTFMKQNLCHYLNQEIIKQIIKIYFYLKLKKQELKKSDNPLGYGEAYIILDNQVKYTYMEYSQFTEVLAQVWAITSLLLLSRYIFQFISRVYIAQDFQGVLLKYYYKKTALRLQEKESQMDQDCSNLDYRQKAQKIIQQNDEIESNVNYFNVNRYERWKRFLIPSFCLKRAKKINQNQYVLNQLKKQLNKDMCFYEMQKEFLRLKTAVKLLLSPEQYAAIHMCGCDLIDYEKNSEIQQNQSCQQQDNQVSQVQEISDKESNLSSSDIQNPINSHQLEDYIHKQQSLSLKCKNHLELMEQVDVDFEYRQICLERFLKDIQQIQGSDQVIINQRILNCMIGIQGYKLDLRYLSEKKNNPHNYIEYQEFQNNYYKMNS
ncbi:hypothetical protein ABPG74_004621 [Tetrahymena malaccensis]